MYTNRENSPKLFANGKIIHIILILILISGFFLRFWGLDQSGLQNDEQLWHERSVRFIKSVLGPFGPRDFTIPKVYYHQNYVDLCNSGWSISKTYPFNIVMPAPHPGAPSGFLMGLCYLFLADGSSSWSFNKAPIVAVTRYPGVIMGSLLIAMIYFGGRHLIGETAALFAAALCAVEPYLIGFSRLGRIDLSGATWATGAVLTFFLAVKYKRILWAVLAGIFAGLAAATNPYGLFIAPALVAIKIMFGTEGNSSETFRAKMRTILWPSKLDVILIFSGLLAFIFAYPNLWPNPIAGVHRIILQTLALPHVSGNELTYPFSRLFYIKHISTHLLPWTAIFIFIAIVTGVWRNKNVLLLCIWVGFTALLFSLPAGRKAYKNLNYMMPGLMMLAGVGCSWLLGWLCHRFNILRTNIPAAVFLILIIAGGTASTLAWWPYPALYTWPWLSDPQTKKQEIILGTGEGIKEALAYIKQVGPPNAKVSFITGAHNAEYFYDPQLVGDVRSPEKLANYNWLVVLPKYAFSNAPSPMVRWVQSREPDHIIRLNQIELARLFRLR